MDKFTTEEVATIRKFFAWVKDGKWLSYDEAITGIADDGVMVTEYQAVSDYDSYTLERSETCIPWIALTDPDEYARQVAQAKVDADRERRKREAAYRRQQEAAERSTYEALKRKFG
jgi:hypothetical protein